MLARFRIAMCALLCSAFLTMPSDSESGAETPLFEDETLKIATQIEVDGVPRRYSERAWRGNPAVRDQLYLMASTPGGNISRRAVLDYIGMIGDASDVTRLIAFIPIDAGAVSYEQWDTLYGVFAGLAQLSNRGVESAGEALGLMTDPAYWKALGTGSSTGDYVQLANGVLHAYAFAGRDDFDGRLDVLVSHMEDPREVEKMLRQLRSWFQSVKVQEQARGTWKMEGFLHRRVDPSPKDSNAKSP